MGLPAAAVCAFRRKVIEALGEVRRLVVRGFQLAFRRPDNTAPMKLAAIACLAAAAPAAAFVPATSRTSGLRAARRGEAGK